MTTKTLAEKLFETTQLEDELFDKLSNILIGKTSGLSAKDWEMGLIDFSWDEYDCSVEVIRSATATPMTREQANQILDLGFNCVYESCGESGCYWDKKGCYQCSYRGADEQTRIRGKFRNACKRIQDLENSLRPLVEMYKDFTRNSDNITFDNAYYTFYKYGYSQWNEAIAILNGCDTLNVK